MRRHIQKAHDLAEVGLLLVPMYFGILCGAAWNPAQGSPPVLQVDGQPFFVMGWYTSYGSSSVADSQQYLSTMRHQGMNTALICYGVWTYNPYMTNQLEGAITSDMKIMVEVNRYAVQELAGYPLSLIDDEVDLCKTYSSFLNWYLIDEPEAQVTVVTPAMAQARYNQIKTRDPNHSISVVHAPYGNPRPAEIYLAAEPPPYCDVLMSDAYEIGESSPEFGATLWRIAKQAGPHAGLAETHGKNAYIAVVQTHGGDFGFRIPTYFENRYISYAPIVQGARGLLYWMHNAYTSEGHRSIVVPAVAHEIQSLVPAIISNSTAVSVSSNKDDYNGTLGITNVNYLFGADERRGYLIATNNTPNAFSVQFQLSGAVLAGTLGTQANVPVMFEQRSVTAQPTGNPNNWTLTDGLSPFGVHVYRLYELAASGGAADPPGKASKAHPEDLSTSVGRTFDLSWSPGTDASAYNVYFGTTIPPTSQGQQPGTIFDPGQMAFNTTYYWRIDPVNNQGTTAGDLWSFTTVAPNPPGKATNPSPTDSAGNVDVNADLAWKPGDSARSYSVYFGTTHPPAFRGNQAGFAFDPGTMVGCTTYYWRIDPVNDDGTTTGDVWSFTTQAPSNPPGQASNPNPPNQAAGVALNANLSWAATNATKYDVYFGTTDPPAFRISQTGTSYSPGPLALHATYYWRIDSANACVTTPGMVWSFATKTGDFDTDGDVDQDDFAHLQNCFSGSAVAYGSGCSDADLDGDGDVDTSDFNVFLPCLAGADQPPGC